MTLSGDSLVVKDSQFLHLATSYNAILLLESGRVSMVNTSFVANQGSVTGGVAVVGVGNMSFQSCNFLSNQGTLDVPAVAVAVAAIAPCVIMQQSLHSVDVCEGASNALSCRKCGGCHLCQWIGPDMRRQQNVPVEHQSKHVS